MQDPTNIYNWRRIDARLTTSGQPTEEQLSEIQKLGVTHVINLGPHDHEYALPNEEAGVSGLGMVYIHIPVDFDNPAANDFERFCSTLSELGVGPVHVHCIANLRVTAFLYKYWRDVQGASELDARKAMDTVWRPGGVWAKFIGDEASARLDHRPPLDTE